MSALDLPCRSRATEAIRRPDVQTKSTLTMSLDDQALEALDDEAPVDQALDDEAPVDQALDDEALDDKALDDKALVDKAPDDEAPDDKAPDDEAPDDKAPDDEAPETKMLDGGCSCNPLGATALEAKALEWTAEAGAKSDANTGACFEEDAEEAAEEAAEAVAEPAHGVKADASAAALPARGCWLCC